MSDINPPGSVMTGAISRGYPFIYCGWNRVETKSTPGAESVRVLCAKRLIAEIYERKLYDRQQTTAAPRDSRVASSGRMAGCSPQNRAPSCISFGRQHQHGGGARSPVARRGWQVFLHVDMLKGLTTDADGLKFWPITWDRKVLSALTRTPFKSLKKQLGRHSAPFVVDSQSIETGINQVRTARPDAVELMPGLIPRAIRQMVQQLPCPIIAGGLVTESEQISAALHAGACSVSTSRRVLWDWGE